jgi:hypothetical protein
MAPWSVIRILLVLSVVVAGLLAWAVQSGRVDVPAHWNPWAPLNVAEPPNWLTGYKLQRTAADPTLCSAVLAASNLKHTAVPDNATGGLRLGGCGAGGRRAFCARIHAHLQRGLVAGDVGTPCPATRCAGAL